MSTVDDLGQRWERVVRALLAGEEAHEAGVRACRSDSGRILCLGDLTFALIEPSRPKKVIVPRGHDPEARALREIIWHQAEQAGYHVEMDNDALLRSGGSHPPGH
jgi:hypothetical protein